MKDVKHEAYIPNRWMGESEINPEAIVDYPSLASDPVVEDYETDLMFANYSHNEATMFNILKNRQQAPGNIGSFRRLQWRVRNPDIATFIKEGRELYEGDFRPIAVLKTNFKDYLRLVYLVRRDIYRNEIFLSPALLIRALYFWGGVVRADRKTALRFIKKMYRKCFPRRTMAIISPTIWEYKNMMIKLSLMEASKREFIGNVRGLKRRTLVNDIRACPTLNRRCKTGEEAEYGR